MKAAKADKADRLWAKYNLPFVDAAKMVQPHISLETASEELDGSYGLGWVRVCLPCTLGAIGLNHDFVGKMPVVGRGMLERTECWYHQGSANSFLSSVHLLPGTESGVVVLTNSMAQNDVADWIGELYIQTILDAPFKNDYIKLAEVSAETALSLWPAMRKELKDNRIPNTAVRPFSEYVGVHYNGIGNYHIEIFQKDGKLLMRFQREKNIAYKMTHYRYDVFSWLITHDRDAKLGRFPITRASFYLIRFDCFNNTDARIDSLVWIHDDEVPEGEHFFKKDTVAAEEMVLTPDEAEPVEERGPESVKQIALEIDGTTQVVHDDANNRLEVAVVATELEDKTEGMMDPEAAVVGAQRQANGKL